MTIDIDLIRHHVDHCRRHKEYDQITFGVVEQLCDHIDALLAEREKVKKKHPDSCNCRWCRGQQTKLQKHLEFNSKLTDILERGK